MLFKWKLYNLIKNVWLKIKKNGYFSLKFHAHTIKMRPLPSFYEIPIVHNFNCKFWLTELDIKINKEPPYEGRVHS